MAISLCSLPLLTSLTLSNNKQVLRANGVSPSLQNNNRPSTFAVLAADEATTKQKGKALIKPLKERQVVLRFVWMEKNIGLGLDQIVPGYGTLPLTPYYFWPRKDAWEELKTELERRKWISKQLAVLLLNQATDVINLWQQNASP